MTSDVGQNYSDLFTKIVYVIYFDKQFLFIKISKSKLRQIIVAENSILSSFSEILQT